MPEQLPEWNSVGVEPPQSLKDSGWQPGMKPSAQHMNWLLNRAYKCIEKLQQAGGNIDDLTQVVADLEQTVDTKFTEVDGDITAVDMKVDKHIKDDSGHVRFIGNASGGDGMACRTDLAPVDLVNGKLVPRKGHAFRFFKVDPANQGPATLALVSDTLPGNPSSIAYPILSSDGQALKGGEMAKNGIYTLAFNGTAFFLQGSGSGVTSPTNGSQAFTTPGTYNFTVPKGVTRITYKMWGAGGGGGGSSFYRRYVGGGGGGSGAYASGVISVNPGSTLRIAVGAGGAGGLPNTDGNTDKQILGGTGGNSYITGAITDPPYVAGGGGGGGCPYNTNVGKAGGGGWTTSGFSAIDVNDSAKQGEPYSIAPIYEKDITAFITGTSGAFADQSGYTGGGGGGGCSDAYAGNVPYVNTGGPQQNKRNYYNGAAGGNGGVGSNGGNGSVGSGGGGGSSYESMESHKTGGKGGDGRVILYW